MPDLNVRFVSMTGSDAYDGLSPDSPKRSVAAALAALPSGRGSVRIGPGIFDETGLTVNCGVIIEGSGTDSTGGTVLRLATGATTHLIAPAADFADYAHHLSIRNLRLDGNKANNSGDLDCLVLKRGGYNCELRNVSIMNAPRYGLRVQDNALNVHLDNVTFAGCVNSALHFALDGATITCATVNGVQIDDCGVDAPITIVDTSGSEGKLIRYLAFRGVKVEQHEPRPHVIAVTPNGASPLAITVDGLVAHNWSGTADAVLYEAQGSGPAALWNIGMVLGGPTFAYVFRSEPRGERLSGGYTLAALAGTQWSVT